MEKEELYNMCKSIIELHKQRYEIKYYFSINPLVTAQYINYYKEQNDPEGIKFGNKVEIKVNKEETK